MNSVKNFKLFSESIDNDDDIDGGTTIEIQEIISMMNQCVDSGWEENLNKSYRCVVLENSNNIEYNGWYEKLVNLKSKIPTLNEIDKMISLNISSLWNKDLEDTFQCVVLEDIISDVEYNGWDRKLELLK